TCFLMGPLKQLQKNVRTRTFSCIANVFAFYRLHITSRSCFIKSSTGIYFCHWTVHFNGL
ncbi:hypothetical protein WUBG_15571, partial [Wuchereria bancrofti]